MVNSLCGIRFHSYKCKFESIRNPIEVNFTSKNLDDIINLLSLVLDSTFFSLTKVDNLIDMS